MITDFISQPASLPGFLATASGLFVIVNVGFIVYNALVHPLRKYPGPFWRKSSFIPYASRFFYGDQPQDTVRLHKKYGDVVRISPNQLSYNTSQAWKEIYGFRHGKQNLAKDGDQYLRPNQVVPDIIVCNHADHSRMRRLLSHAFSETALREQEPIIRGYFDLLFNGLQGQIDGPAQGEVDLCAWFNWTTFDIIGDLSFGESFHGLEQQRSHPWIQDFFRGYKFLSMMRAFVLYPMGKSLLSAGFKHIPSFGSGRKKHNIWAREMTGKRLDLTTDRRDFISDILQHNNKAGMSREEILYTAGIFIIAGSETTATLLSGATFFLCTNPDKLAKVQRLVRDAFAQESDISFKSTESVHLPYLHAVIEESLRMYPPVPGTLCRTVPPEGDTILGRYVPPGTKVGVDMLAVSRSERNFHNPMTFAPERWLSADQVPAEYKGDDLAASNPFSTGPRNCLGKNLAYAEMRSILARMIWNFDFELVPGQESWPDQKVFLFWRKPELKVRLTRRKMQ